jgi:hypothetical protein
MRASDVPSRSPFAKPGQNKLFAWAASLKPGDVVLTSIAGLAAATGLGRSEVGKVLAKSAALFGLTVTRPIRGKADVLILGPGDTPTRFIVGTPGELPNREAGR